MDPELARRERARLTEEALRDGLREIAALQRRFGAHSSAHVQGVEAPRRRTVVRRRLLVAAVVGVALLAAVPFLSGSREQSASARSVAVSYGVLAARTTPRREPVVHRRPASVSDRAHLEREIRELIRAAPPAKLPHSFVDATGHVPTTLTVVCRAHGRSYRCLARIPTDAPRRGILVAYRYRPGGGVYAWYGYVRLRRGS